MVNNGIIQYSITKFQRPVLQLSLELVAVIFMTSSLLTLPGCENQKGKRQLISAADPRIQYIGRFDFTDPRAPSFAWTGSAIRFRFKGTGFGIILKQLNHPKDEYHTNYFAVIIDSVVSSLIRTSPDSHYDMVVDGLAPGIHQVEIFRRTEASCGISVFEGIQLSADAKLLDPPTRPTRKIEFIGNSITCGFGNEAESELIQFSPETEDGYRAYGAIAARQLNAEYHAVCYSGRGIYRNYDQTTTGLMPELYQLIYPQSDKRWDFKTWIPDVVVINLGTNDFAAGIADSARFISHYLDLLRQIKSHYPAVTVICLDGPMLTDTALMTCRKFIKSAVSEFLKQGNNSVFSFSLTTQGPLGLGGDYHPNLTQHNLNAEELVPYIKTVMKW